MKELCKGKGKGTQEGWCYSSQGAHRDYQSEDDNWYMCAYLAYAYDRHC